MAAHMLLPMLLGAALSAPAAEPVAEEAPFEVRTLVQAYLESTALADGTGNPANGVARLARRRAVLEWRPDLAFATDTLEIRASPRLRVQQATTAGAGGSTAHAAGTAYLNEWLLRAMPSDSVAVSVGRQVLLWGPATLYSPSNPFYGNNGRDNPYVERDGTDFFVATYFPAPGWTLAYIDNFAQGRLALSPLTPFAHTRLLKLDWTGTRSYWSVNYASAPHTGARIGGAGQWTVSDALVAYVEGAYLRHRTAWRPEPGAEAGAWQFAAPAAQGGAGIGVAGASYTFASGPTLSMEYLHNSQGWNAREFAGLARVTQQAAARLDGPMGNAALLQLARAAAPGMDLPAKNYVFFQYLHPDPAAGRDVTLRATRSMEGHAWRFGATVEQRFAGRYSMFAQFVGNTDAPQGEFSRYVRWQLQWGLKAGF